MKPPLLLYIAFILLLPLSVFAEDLEITIEGQTSFSTSKTPLWLNANKHGLSSLSSSNGYLRAMAFGHTDSTKTLLFSYGADFSLAYNHHSSIFVQQAFGELMWKNMLFSLGAKEQNMQLKNDSLSSGSQTLGINAHPVPEFKVALPNYIHIPYTKDWLSLKGHISYGIMTDGSWQRNFTCAESKFVEHTLYHSKAGYLLIGKPSTSAFSLELGLEMATLFGGRIHDFIDGEEFIVDGSTSPKAFINALIPGGSDYNETKYQNIEGNQLGSWLARLNWSSSKYNISVYADKYFEDHSSMFNLDYDGYGSGDDWNKKQHSRFVLYDFKDWMLGVEVEFKRCPWLDHMLLEYLYTEYQSGPIYHDHTENISDHIGGTDGFYNHYIYSGWQHWGQVIGNPLYLSPVYNTNGNIKVENNRFTAFHFAIDGTPFPSFYYRAMLTWQEGLGNYDLPYLNKKHSTSVYLEGKYCLPFQIYAKLSIAADFGSLRGNSKGLQFTLSKHF